MLPPKTKPPTNSVVCYVHQKPITGSMVDERDFEKIGGGDLYHTREEALEACKPRQPGFFERLRVNLETLWGNILDFLFPWRV